MKISPANSDEVYSKMGIKSTNMLKNLGTFLLAFVGIAGIIILLVLFKKLMLKLTLTSKLYNFIEGKIFFNALIRSLLTAYLTMCISTLISIQDLKTETSADIASTAITIGTLAIIAVAPYLAYQF